MSTTVGGCEANFSLAVSLPSTSTSSSRTILMTCSPGERAVSHFLPDGLGLDLVDELLDDFEVDVGFEQRQPNFAQGLADVFVGEDGLSAQGLEGALQFFLKILKHRRKPLF